MFNSDPPESDFPEIFVFLHNTWRQLLVHYFFPVSGIRIGHSCQPHV